MAKKSSANVISAIPKEDMDWRARSDCMTLQQAEEIRRDSKRHGAAQKHAAKEAKSLAKIAKK